MPGDNKKHWQLFVHGYKGKVLSFEINKDSSIKHLIDMIAKEVKLKPKEIIVLYAGKQLDLNTAGEKYFEDYDLHNLSTLVLVTRVRGGQNLKGQKKSTKTRYTPDPCIISDEDSDEISRVEMPCGHAIVPSNLKEFCRQKLKKGEYVFVCPIKTCKTVWSYSTIRRYAGLTHEEMEEFEMKITMNYAKRILGDVVKCPGCKSYCLLEDDNEGQILCPHCTEDRGKKVFFCRYCLGSWRGNRPDVCGNDGCDRADPRLYILNNCGDSTDVFNAKQRTSTCPRIRACIKCGTLNYHDGGCKRIPCKACKFDFCLICVRPFTSKKGKGGCGYGVLCNVAPTQTSIPTKRAMFCCL